MRREADKRWTLHHGDCLAWLRTLPSESVDALITDPPYAEIDRAYGRLSEPDWHELMTGVVTEVRRVLKPCGSAVFILQANCERVGRVRPWLWEFMARWSREWNMVQDAWWWNRAALPTVHSRSRNGLMRPSVKACVWLGAPDCYRDQSSVLLPLSEATKQKVSRATNELVHYPSGARMRNARCLNTAVERGGSTPFNLIQCANVDSTNSAGAHGHGAGTAYPVADWWVRYITPPDGIVCDPFTGSGTMGLAALARGHAFIGAEKMPEYYEIARKRLTAAAQGETVLRTAEPNPTPAERGEIAPPKEPRPKQPRKAAEPQPALFVATEDDPCAA